MQTVTFSVELPHRWLRKSVEAKMPFLFLFCFLHSQMRSLSYYEVFHLILFVALNIYIYMYICFLLLLLCCYFWGKKKKMKKFMNWYFYTFFFPFISLFLIWSPFFLFFFFFLSVLMVVPDLSNTCNCCNWQHKCCLDSMYAVATTER